MENEAIDYKKIFESVFENAECYELGCILGNEDVPFEYCRKALKIKRLDWRKKVLIAKRSDCPDDVLIKICKRQGERFTRELLCSKKAFLMKHWRNCIRIPLIYMN